MKVAICLPGKTFSGKFLNSFVNLIGGMTREKINYAVINSYSSLPVYSVRQEIMDISDKQFIPDYYLWIDADQVFCFEDFKKLLAMDLPIASGVYKTEWGVWCLGFMRKDNSCIMSMTTLPKDPIEVDFVGFGFCLIKREVIEAIEKPYFVDFYDKEKFHLDDIAFFEKTRRKGFKTIINPEVIIGHEKLITL